MGNCISRISSLTAGGLQSGAEHVSSVSPEPPKFPLNSLSPELKALVAKNLTVPQNKRLRLTNRSFRQAGAPQLQVIKIPLRQIGSLERILKNLADVQKVQITGFGNDPEGELRQLAALNPTCLAKITHLHLHHPDISDAALAHLAGMPQMQTLRLMNCPAITDTGLAHLRGMNQLKTLILTHCETVTDTGLGHLAGMSAMETCI